MVDSQIVRVLNAIKFEPDSFQSHRSDCDDRSWRRGHRCGRNLLRGQSRRPLAIKNYTIPFFLWGLEFQQERIFYGLFSNRGDPGTNRVDYTVVPQRCAQAIRAILL